MGARRRLGASVLVATLAVATSVGCGGNGGDEPQTQPAPDVTTVVEGDFDQLPQFPRSEPAGPKSEKDGVVARSYRARGASPEQVLEYYRDKLEERRWTMVGPIEQIGVGTFRARWTRADDRLLVSATREPPLAEDAPSHEATVQYSLSLEGA